MANIKCPICSYQFDTEDQNKCPSCGNPFGDFLDDHDKEYLKEKEDGSNSM